MVVDHHGYKVAALVFDCRRGLHLTHHVLHNARGRVPRNDMLNKVKLGLVLEEVAAEYNWRHNHNSDRAEMT